MTAKRNGPPVGQRQRNKEVQYNPASGKGYRPRTNLDPAEAAKVIRWAEQAGMSVAGVLAELAKHTPEDPTTGLPPFIKPRLQTAFDDLQEAS